MARNEQTVKEKLSEEEKHMIVLLLVIVALVTIFSVQNASPVAVSLLFWRFEASLAIVIFLSVLTGIVMAALFSFSNKLRHPENKQKKPETETASSADQ